MNQDQEQPPPPPDDRPGPAERLIRLLCDELAGFSRRALRPRPDDPPATQARLAAEALLVVGLLVEHGAGWAIEVHRREVLAGEGGAEGGAAPPGPAPDPGPAAGAALERRFLASVVNRAGVVPPGLRQELCAALQALDQGEVRPLLAPDRRGRWRDPHSLALLRLHALLHVHLRWGGGLKKVAAVAEVAAALATSPANVRKWERVWVPEIVGGDVPGTLAMAREAGRLAARHPEGVPERHVAARGLLAVLEGEMTLARVAEEHRRVMARGAAPAGGRERGGGVRATD